MIIKKLSVEKTPYAINWRKHALEEFKKECVPDMMVKINERYESFCLEHKKEKPGVKVHTENRLFPVIALYQTLLEYVEQQCAMELTQKWFYETVIQQINSMKKYVNEQNQVKQFPFAFAAEMEKSYSEEAGFCMEFLCREKDCVKLHITSCLYLRFTEYYGCPELCRCFCRTDDMCYEDIHTDIIWERKGTLAEGKEYCDFSISISQNCME